MMITVPIIMRMTETTGKKIKSIEVHQKIKKNYGIKRRIIIREIMITMQEIIIIGRKKKCNYKWK